MSTSPIQNHPDSLNAWLNYAEHLTEKPIELGLTRMRTMIARMGICFSCPVFTVAGTNGKGSTCAFLSSVLLAAGYRVGMHTSPNLIRFNERAVIAEPLPRLIVQGTECRLRTLSLRGWQF